MLVWDIMINGFAYIPWIKGRNHQFLVSVHCHRPPIGAVLFLTNSELGEGGHIDCVHQGKGRLFAEPPQQFVASISLMFELIEFESSLVLLPSSCLSLVVRNHCKASLSKDSKTTQKNTDTIWSLNVALRPYTYFPSSIQWFFHQFYWASYVWNILIYLYIYTIWLWHSQFAMERSTMFKNGTLW